MSTTITGDFTYNVATLRGIVRLNSRDIDSLSPINKDSEVDAMLMMTGSIDPPTGVWDTTMINTIYLAAANCFDLMAGDAAKVAIIEKIASFTDNTKVTYDALKDMAQTLRDRASGNTLPSVGPIGVYYVNGIAVNAPPDPFYNSPWTPMRNNGDGTTTPRSPLESW
jgi:hypothetical protein